MAKKEVNLEEIGNRRLTKPELEKLLLENFVSLQKVLTNLSIKFETLSSNISRLLEIFETSAKSFAEKNDKEGSLLKDHELINKMEILLDQNKIIAKGLTLIEGRLRESPHSNQDIFSAEKENLRNINYPGISQN